MISECKETLKEAGWFAFKTAAVSAAIYGGVYTAIPAIGLPVNSIAAGTVASYYQCKYNRMLRVSTISLIKRVSLKGITVASKVGMIAATKTATGIYSVYKNFRKNKEKTENKEALTGKISNSCNEKEDYNEHEESLYEADWEDIQWPDDLIRTSCAKT